VGVGSIGDGMRFGVIRQTLGKYRLFSKKIFQKKSFTTTMTHDHQPSWISRLLVFG
jgi:hypothetical protein